MSILIRITVHPHTCGVYSSMLQSRAAFCGPSPRARGLRPAQRWSCHPPSVHPHARRVYDPEWPCRLRQDRSIPTYVGFTNSAGASCTQGSVHPHIRGVYYGGLDLSTTTDGPSPHTWGLRLVEDRPEDLHRSIPTYVGFTTSPSSTRPGRTVHPHIRGVYTAAAVASYVLAGPSPHTWGLRKGAPVGRIAERSIPTYVGFTLK